jgi:hypothetical protein
LIVFQDGIDGGFRDRNVKISRDYCHQAPAGNTGISFFLADNEIYYFLAEFIGLRHAIGHL